MTATVMTATTVGVDARLVHVEVDTDRKLPSFTIVGLPDSAVRESRERVMAAIRNAGFQWPRRRVTVNLAPAGDHRFSETGTILDLGQELAVSSASGEGDGRCGTKVFVRFLERAFVSQQFDSLSGAQAIVEAAIGANSVGQVGGGLAYGLFAQ